METDKTVAITILNQLGGNKFRAMTGAKDFYATNNSMGFRLPGGGGFCKNGVNYVKITLNSMDTYDVEFKRIRGHKITDVAEHAGIYNDMLQAIFTKETGLDTHL